MAKPKLKQEDVSKLIRSLLGKARTQGGAVLPGAGIGAATGFVTAPGQEIENASGETVRQGPTLFDRLIRALIGGAGGAAAGAGVNALRRRGLTKETVPGRGTFQGTGPSQGTGASQGIGAGTPAPSPDIAKQWTHSRDELDNLIRNMKLDQHANRQNREFTDIYRSNRVPSYESINKELGQFSGGTRGHSQAASSARPIYSDMPFGDEQAVMDRAFAGFVPGATAGAVGGFISPGSPVVDAEGNTLPASFDKRIMGAIRGGMMGGPAGAIGNAALGRAGMSLRPASIGALGAAAPLSIAALDALSAPREARPKTGAVYNNATEREKLIATLAAYLNKAD